ncbi:MAG TPA: hypothetical protein PLN69_05005 [bacterium]|nr:hypothetical protein [bacterium]
MKYNRSYFGFSVVFLNIFFFLFISGASFKFVEKQIIIPETIHFLKIYLWGMGSYSDSLLLISIIIVWIVAIFGWIIKKRKKGEKATDNNSIRNKRLLIINGLILLVYSMLLPIILIGLYGYNKAPCDSTISVSVDDINLRHLRSFNMFSQVINSMEDYGIEKIKFTISPDKGIQHISISNSCDEELSDENCCDLHNQLVESIDANLKKNNIKTVIEKHGMAEYRAERTQNTSSILIKTILINLLLWLISFVGMYKLNKVKMNG